MKEIAIIGGGLAGLSAAWSLTRQGRDPVVFEKSRGLSGRAASRSRGDVRFDHGANFFKLDDPVVDELVRTKLPTEDLVEIPGDVWTFDGSGSISEGDQEQNAEPKWTYRHGISQLGKLLVAASGVEVKRQTRVARMELADGKWTLWDTDGGELGNFKQVLLAAPGPQCREIIEASVMEASVKAGLLEGLADSQFHRQYSFILGYERALDRSRPFHALVSSQRDHPVAWLSFEEDKPGHLPEGQGALVVQMSSDWTDLRLEVDREALLEEVLHEVGLLLGDEFRRPDWWDSQRWMLALPAAPADAVALRVGQGSNLFFAGDSLVGRGRVPLAMASGLEAAECMLRQQNPMSTG